MSNSVLPPLEPAVRSYVAAFNLHAIAQMADGRLVVSRNPAGAVAAHWCEGQREAGFILKLAQAGNLTVSDAAQQLHIKIGPHATVVAKATESVAKLNDALDRAHDRGALRVFNRRYREARELAHAQGRSFPSYARVRARLMAELYRAAAAGGVSDGIIAKVFGGH